MIFRSLGFFVSNEAVKWQVSGPTFWSGSFGPYNTSPDCIVSFQILLYDSPCPAFLLGVGVVLALIV